MVGMAGGNDIRLYVGDQLIGEVQNINIEYEKEATSVVDRVYEGTFTFEGAVVFGKYHSTRYEHDSVLWYRADELRKETHRRAAREGLRTMRVAKARQTGKGYPQ